MTESLVDRLRRLDKEATPIGWTTCKFGVSPRGEGGGFHWHPNGDDDAEANGQLIVATRNALPELLRLVTVVKTRSQLEHQAEAAGREGQEIEGLQEAIWTASDAVDDALAALVEPLTESQT